MKTLIVYDSVYGNTEKIAKAMAKAVGAQSKIVRAGDADGLGLEKYGLVIIGSPTHGGRPTKATQEFLGKIPQNGLTNVRAAAFDTRMAKGNQGVFVRAIINFFGYAAPQIAESLKRKGAQAVASEGFAVKGKEGPLADGELERAAQWAKGI